MSTVVTEANTMAALDDGERPDYVIRYITWSRQWRQRRARCTGTTVWMVDDEICTLFACRGADFGASERWRTENRTITGGDHAILYCMNNGRLERQWQDDDITITTAWRKYGDRHDRRKNTTRGTLEKCADYQHKHGLTRHTRDGQQLDPIVSKRQTSVSTFVTVGDLDGVHGLRDALSSGPIAARRDKNGGKFEQNVS